MKISSEIKSKSKAPKLQNISEIVKEDGVYRIHGNEYSNIYFIVCNGFILTNDYSPPKIVCFNDEGWEGYSFYKTDDEIVLTFKNK